MKKSLIPLPRAALVPFPLPRMALMSFHLRTNFARRLILLPRAALMLSHLRTNFARRLILLPCAALMLLMSASCVKGKSGAGNSQSDVLEIAVFIPGVVSGSPTYSMLAEGVKEAASLSKPPVNVTIIEAGFNQAEWEAKLTAIASQNKYALIASSNPALPYIADSVSKKIPSQKFMILDGKLEGNPNIYTLQYNQREEAYMAGYLASLLSFDKNGGAKNIGLVAAQRYPVMDNVISKAYLEGAAAAASDYALPNSGALSLDFRIVGSWNDTNKAAETASAMFKNSVRVILTIAGEANNGVLQAAQEHNGKILWFDTNAYATRPGIIAGCAVIKQDKAAREKTASFLSGTLPFGTAETVGVKEGFVDFADSDPLYISTVPEDVRTKQTAMLSRLRSGELVLPLE